MYVGGHPALAFESARQNSLDFLPSYLTFHKETWMSHWRSIALILLAVAYFLAAYGNSLRVMMAPVGSGVPAVQRATGHPKEAPHPNWTPRRHLPLVKIFSIDHLLTIGRELTSDRDCSRPYLLQTISFFCKEHFGSPSPGRAPPVT